MVENTYTWTIKLSNGVSYNVKSKENTIEEFLKTLIPHNLNIDVTGFDLATPTKEGNNCVAFFAKEVIAVEWKC